MLNAQLIRERATDMGFDLVGFAPAAPTPQGSSFLDWLQAGHHGEMNYLARDPHKRTDPRHVLGNCQTVIMVGVSYETLAVPMALLQDPSRGRIARYAWGADYHDHITPKLRELGDWVAQENRSYVDTGPVMERAWAQACGLGFVGKNTCLIHRERGSFLFLGAILVAQDIQDEQATQQTQTRKSLCGCGNCTRCLTACPTHAFPEPGVLDARRCISYLTIELKGSIPLALRPHMGNWIFGCDICQDVCPYVRRYATATKTNMGAAFFPSDGSRAAPKLIDVLGLDRAQFNQRYNNTPLQRAKRRGVLRNACVAAGNWGNPAAQPALRALLQDEEPLVREHAQWALERVG